MGIRISSLRSFPVAAARRDMLPRDPVPFLLLDEKLGRFHGEIVFDLSTLT